LGIIDICRIVIFNFYIAQYATRYIAQKYNFSEIFKKFKLSLWRKRWCCSTCRLIDIIVIVVNARKCNGDSRARRDTTCHAFSFTLSPSPSREFDDNAAYGSIPASRRPAVCHCSVPSFTQRHPVLGDIYAFSSTESLASISCTIILPLHF